MFGRLIALWRVHAYLDLLFVARGFRQALVYMLSDVVIGAATITGTFLIVERFGNIGDWGRDHVLFMLGYALLAGGCMDLFFGMNVASISRRIGRGQLDHSLLQPQPLWMGLLTEGFLPFSGTGKVVPGAALLLYATSRLALEPTPGWLALLVLNVLGSVAVVLGFQYLWAVLAFWSPRGAEEINSSTFRLFSEIQQFPLDGLRGPARAGLLSILPVGFVAWYPCRALLGLDPSGYAPLVTPLAALVMWLAAAWAFSRGLKQYGRTGSTRYLSHGFRR